MEPNPINPGWLPLHIFHPALSLSVERYLLRGTPGRTRRMLAQAGFRDLHCVFAGLVPPPLWGRVARLDEAEQWLTSIPVLRKLALYLLIRGDKSGESG